MPGAPELVVPHPSLAPDWREALSVLAAQPAWRPFDPRAAAFVAAFSNALLQEPAFREFPASVALGYWFRDAAVASLRRSLPGQPGQDRRGRGLVFHVAPANVETLFLYSCLLSLLAGNTNAVRTSQRRSGESAALFGTMNRLLQLPDHAETARRLLLLTYPRDHEASVSLSAACDLRILWGGDETIRQLRQVPLKPTALDVAFADRQSLAVLSARHVIAAEDQALGQLVEGFHNDAYWFAQQACASPRALVWVEDGDVAAAQGRFWPRLEACVAARQIPNPAEGMSRLHDAAAMSADGAVTTTHAPTGSHYPWRVEVARLTGSTRTRHAGYGLFVETRIARLVDLAPQLHERDQTVTVAGIPESAIRELLDAIPGGAVQRVVPVGHALDFQPVWDGIELLPLMTRVIPLP